MRDFPLLDLRDDWRDVSRALNNIDALAESLFCDSEHTWGGMALIRAKVHAAREALGTLPPDVLKGIAEDERDFDEAEGRAYTGY